jgi:hypothetical protein
MDIFQKIAEGKILEAMKRGEFDDLPNKGKPLNLEEDAYISEDVRIAYKILKNAGCLPPELELRKEIISLREIIDTLDDDKERLKRIRQLNFKLLKLDMMRKTPFNIDNFPEYEGKILKRFIE